MIERILASRPTGAGAIALDLAINLGIEHGGWTGGDVPVPAKYRLERLHEGLPVAVVEKTVAAADGVVFFLRGDDPMVACRHIRKAAREHRRPLMVVDLDQQTGFMASRQIAEWITEHRIRTLYVDGVCSDSAEGAFSSNVGSILEASLFLAMMETGVTSPLQSVVDKTRFVSADVRPHSVEAALDHLEATLSLKDKATIANMVVGELASLHFTLGDYINRHFGLFTQDSELMIDCRRRSGQWALEPSAAAAFIIRQLWERLRNTHRIRIIK